MALNLFKLRGPVRPKEQIVYDIESVPTFKYLADSKRLFKENTDGLECVCCGKISKYVYYGPFMYTKNLDLLPLDFKEDTILCPYCIQNGAAAKTFAGNFTWSGNIQRGASKEGRREVSHRTPSFYPLQEIRWLSCCGEPCKYVGQMGDLIDLWNYNSVDIEKDIDSGIIEAIRKNDVTKNMTIEEVIETVRCDGIGVYIFQCLHCGKYKVHVDIG